MYHIFVLAALDAYLNLKISQETGTPEARPQRASGPYFLLLAVDSDREIRIPMSSWGLYQNLREGRPARLRKCKVMIRTFGRERWYLVLTRYSQRGARNCAVSEAIGRDWNGPISVAKLERRRDTIPTGIVSSEDYHAAVAAVELYVFFYAGSRRDIWISEELQGSLMSCLRNSTNHRGTSCGGRVSWIRGIQTSIASKFG